MTAGRADRLPLRSLLLIGLAWLGVFVVWLVYNSLLPLILQSGRATFQASAPLPPGFGLSATLTGVIMALDNVAGIVLLPLIGVWSDRTRTRMGRRLPYVLAGMPLAAVSLLLIPLAVGLVSPGNSGTITGNLAPFIMLMVGAVGVLLGMALFRTPLMALLSDVTPSALRSRANGIVDFIGAGLGGLTATLLVVPLFDRQHSLPFLVSVVVLVMTSGLLVLRLKEGVPPPSAEGSLSLAANPFHIIRDIPRGYYRAISALMAAIFAWNIAYNTLETFFSSYAVTVLGLTVSASGQLFSVALGAFIVFAIPAGFIGGSRLGRRRTMSIGLVLFALALLAAYFYPQVGVTVGALAVSGAAYALILENALPTMVDIAEDDALLGTFTGFYYLASQGAAALAPLLNGVMVDSAGGDYRVIMLGAPVFLILALVALVFVDRGEARGVGSL